VEKTITRCECCPGNLDVTCGRDICKARRVRTITLSDGRELWYYVDEYEELLKWQKEKRLR
jgi:hypothetical protein